MSNLLTKLFKSKSAREEEAREKQAKLDSAYEFGKRTSETITSLIDGFRDQKLIPFVRDVLRDYKQSIETHHKDATYEVAIALISEFKTKLEHLKGEAVAALWNSLGDWHAALVDTGNKDMFDEYITKTFDPVWMEADKLATEETAYCLTRISGHMTDEMHAMTPEELERYARHNKLGRFKET